MYGIIYLYGKGVNYMSQKSNKELAVELACAALHAMSNMNQSQKALSGTDIQNILNECYSFVTDLPENKDGV